MAKIGIRDGVISSSAQVSVQVPELRVTGDLIAENYIVSSSVTSLTYQSLSGSTIFGDTPADDTHQFTGSVNVTGSMMISNKLSTSHTLLRLDNESNQASTDMFLDFTVANGATAISRIGSRYVGSNDIDLSFHTFNSSGLGERMRIDKDGNIGIGTASPEAPLHIVGDTMLLADGESDNAIKQGRIGSEHYDVDEEPFYYLYSIVQSDNNQINIGGGTSAGNAATNIQFYTAANSTTTTGTKLFELTGNKISGSAASTGSFGSIKSAGIISADGDVIAFASSDERLKENIKIIENPIEKVEQLRGVEYQWNELQNTYASGSYDSGIIAQDVQKVLPQIVKERNDGYLGVRQERLVGLLIEGIKDQQKQIDELKLQIKEIKDGSS